MRRTVLPLRSECLVLADSLNQPHDSADDDPEQVVTISTTAAPVEAESYRERVLKIAEEYAIHNGGEATLDALERVMRKRGVDFGDITRVSTSVANILLKTGRWERLGSKTFQLKKSSTAG